MTSDPRGPRSIEDGEKIDGGARMRREACRFRCNTVNDAENRPPLDLALRSQAATLHENAGLSRSH